MTNIIFLFFFLPVVFFFYKISNLKMKKFCLLISSIIFTMLTGIMYSIMYIALSIIAFIFGSILKKTSEKFLKNVLSVFFILIFTAIFAFFHLEVSKIINITSYNIIYPMGMSFFILRCITFLNDCRNGNLILKSNFLDFILYLFYFPTFELGPIISYNHFIALLVKSDFTLSNFGKGFTIFITGFSLKIIIADNLFKFINSVYRTNVTSISCVLIWYTALAFFFFIYFLFSSYSKMAEGLSLMFGIKIPKNNFSYFMCDSFTDFSKKWNISVCKVIEKPFLNINTSKASMLFSSLITWIIIGIWLEFNVKSVIFGIIIGILIYFESVTGLSKNKNYLKRIAVFLMLLISFILIMPVNLNLCINYFKALVCQGVPFWNELTSYYLQKYFVLLAISILLALNLKKNFIHSRKTNLPSKIMYLTISTFEICAFILSICILIYNGGYSSVQISL